MTRAPRLTRTELIEKQNAWLNETRSRLNSPASAGMSLSDLEGLLEAKRQELVNHAIEAAKDGVTPRHTKTSSRRPK